MNLSLKSQTTALYEIIELADELNTRVQSLDQATKNDTLMKAVEEAATCFMTDCQQQIVVKASELAPLLRELAEHPRISDPRITSSELPEALLEAVDSVDRLARLAGDLEQMSNRLPGVDASRRARSALRVAQQLVGRMEAGLKGLKVAEQAPIPEADSVFSFRGSRQSGTDAVVWTEMRIDAESRNSATLFALDRVGFVLNTAIRSAPWTKWDILEFRLADVSSADIASLRMQFS